MLCSLLPEWSRDQVTLQDRGTDWWSLQLGRELFGAFLRTEQSGGVCVQGAGGT